MDDVFDSGIPAWRTHVKKSRLETLEEEIATGAVKIERPVGDNPGGIAGTADEKATRTETNGSHEENAEKV